MLLVSEKALKQYGLKARARIHHMSVYSDDPIFMLTAPIPATKRALQKSGLKLEDIDLVEINEAFAPVVLSWFKDRSEEHTSELQSLMRTSYAVFCLKKKYNKE